MSSFKPNYFQRRSKPRGPKANERIRALDVQVIGSDGGNIGAMPLNKAIELARKYDSEFPEINFNEVLEYLKMNKEQFESIVNKHRNNEIWKSARNNKWELINSI